jgi:hypothetical protein
MTKYSNYKDFYLRQKIKVKQKKIFLLKSFLLNQKISKKIRFKIMLKFDRNYNTLIFNKIKNRCMFSTKIRAVSRLTNLTKSTFRDYLR